MYGAKFSGQYAGSEETALTVWAEYLGMLTPEQLKAGLDAWDKEWPPSAPEFRKACLGFSDPQTNEEWQRIGRSIGISAHPGESWPQLISRIRVGMREAVSDFEQNLLGSDQGSAS